MRRLALLLLLGLFATPAPPLRADEGEVPEAVRRASIRRLGRDLAKAARSPRAEKKRDEIVRMLEALEVFGGPAAAEAALGAVVLPDEGLRDMVFAFVDREHVPALVEPLAALLEHKDLRRDEDLRTRVARSLSVVAHPSAVPPLTDLIRTDEGAAVVAAAANALATYGAAPLDLRKDAVRALVDVYTTTWNLMLSIQADQKVIASLMKERWKVYAGPVRLALQALTGQQLSRPQEWRWWWNKNKKRTDW